MKLKITAGALLAWLLLSFGIAKMLPLKPREQWILLALLALLGIIAAGVALWYQARQAKKEAAGGAAGPALDPGDELVQLLRNAEDALSGAKQLPKGTCFGNVPVIFLLGPQGSARTTSVVQSGIEPELLAGQVYAEDRVAPTRLANVWYARQSVFVEPAQPVLDDRNRWLTLIRRMQPGKLKSVMNRGAAAPRAAVVMFDCEKLYNSAASVAAAREIHGQLGEISRQLGISLPVYVLFTRADRIPFFLDYVRTMQDEEASQPFGAALSLADAGTEGAGRGTYQDAQTARIHDVFQRLYQSFAGRRMDFLARDRDGGSTPAGYEFPRELRKLRDSITGFLIDLCRPSQLSVAPFLRGFYFSGVRPVMIRQAVQAPQRSQRTDEQASNATAIFRAADLEPNPASAAPELVTKKVPQWVFLQRFFPDVVLADDVALNESGASVKTNLVRRVLLASAAFVAVCLLAFFTVSYLNNRALVNSVRAAGADVGTGELHGGELPPLNALQRLDNLRTGVQTISEYGRDGAPLGYRWGLYTGNAMLPDARTLYFTRFRQLLLGGIQSRWLSDLRALPDKPGQTDTYAKPYNALKAYLITTSHHEKSTPAFLVPALLETWTAGRELDPDRVSLARKQFEFYANELQFANPYASNNDSAAIAHARRYLVSFAGNERVYRNILAEVNAKTPGVNFNQKFPGTSAVLIDNYDVPGAFTKTGYAAVSLAIKHADQFFAGEQWVLGNQTISVGDLPKLQADLENSYNSEAIQTWRKYLRAGQVVGYSSLADAAKKLRVNSGAESPLLAMLCLGSENTSDGKAINDAFQTLHKVEPPGCRTAYFGPATADYMKNLAALQVALDQAQAAKDPADPSLASAAASATAAKTSVLQLEQSLGVDPDGHIESKIAQLLEAPIKSTDPVMRNLAAGPLNAGGAGVCGQMRPTLAKYPFNPQATQEATLQEVNSLFKPGEGAFWKFYDASLSKALTRTGELIPGTSITFNERYLTFFRRVAAFASAAYGAGTPDPKIDFSLKAVPSDDLQSLRVTLNGVTAEFPAGSQEAHRFAWPGTAPGVVLSGVSKTTGSFTRPYDGLWAAFKFFADANRTPPGGNGVYEWDQKFGATARTMFIVKFDLSMVGAPPVFQKGYFSGLSCIADVAK